MADIQITDQSSIKIPERSGIFGVEKKDWERIKSLIKELKLRSSFWENFAWFFSATTLSFFVNYFSLDNQNNSKHLILVACIASTVITIILFIVNYSFLKLSKEGKNRIITEMENMEVVEKEPSA